MRQASARFSSLWYAGADPGKAKKTNSLFPIHAPSFVFRAGNGDIMSFEEANVLKAHAGTAGVMVARGALHKPWVFTEIKEQR